MPIAPDGTPLPYPEDEFGGAPAPGGDVPPELLGLLGGEEEDELDAEPGGPRGVKEILREMLMLADEYRTVEQDDEDLLDIEKVTTMLQQILANQAKEADGMLQGKSTPRALRRALG